MADENIFSFVQGEVNSLIAKAESEISSLKTAAMGFYSPATTQAGWENNPFWNIDRAAPFTLTTLADLPEDLPTFNIPEFVFNPEDYVNKDLLTKYSYESEFFDNFLEPQLIEFIEAQSYFIAADVQDALFRLTHDRDIQILNDQLDAQDRIEARRGFPMPNAMILVARNEILKQYGDRRSDRNREVTALIAERAHDGVKHATSESIKMEDIRSRFQLEYAKVYWQAADYLIRKYEADIRAAIAEYQSLLDMIRANTAVDEKVYDSERLYEEMENTRSIERLRASIAEMNGNIDTWKHRVTAQIEAAKDAVEYYKSAVSSATSIMNDVRTNDGAL